MEKSETQIQDETDRTGFIVIRERSYHLPFDVIEELNAISAQVRELQQDLDDARNGWEAAVEAVRELEQSLATAREEVLEEAAKSLDNMPNLEMDEHGDWHHNYPRNCADALRARAKAIRALKPTTEAGGGETKWGACNECGAPVPMNTTRCGACEFL